MYKRENINQIMEAHDIIPEIDLDTISEKENKNITNQGQGISSEKIENIQDKKDLQDQL